MFVIGADKTVHKLLDVRDWLVSDKTLQKVLNVRDCLEPLEPFA